MRLWWRGVTWSAAAALPLAGLLSATAQAQFLEPLDIAHPAIGYGSPSSMDRFAALIGRLQRGERALTMEPNTGYLRSLLEALDVPVESQIVVFSKSSF